MNVGQALDREAVLNDIELLTGKRPAGSRYDERKWSIALPQELTRAIAALPAVRVGRRIDQAARCRSSSRDPACPVALISEFLGGLFGADGHAPMLSRHNSNEDSAVLTPPAYSQSAKPEHVQQLQETMHSLVGLLVRCGVKARGARIDCFPVRGERASSYARARDGVAAHRSASPADGGPVVRRTRRLPLLCRQMAACQRRRGVLAHDRDTINRQRLWMADRLETLHRQAH